MNANQIVNMVMRMVVRKLVRSGMNAVSNRMARPRKKTDFDRDTIDPGHGA